VARAVGDARGVALITTMYVLFTVGMMLFAFGFMMQGEARFASLNRNSTMALDLAEAGAQEALKRLTMFGFNVGTPATFTNSLAGSGSQGTVTYQASVQGNPSEFPILSTATVAGSQRAVRIFVQAVYRAGMSQAIFGQKVNYGGDASGVLSNTYALTSVQIDAAAEAPSCASGMSPTNLVPPQVMAATTISASAGPAFTFPCGVSYNGAAVLYTTECASGSLTEVTPTPCPGGRTMSAGNLLLYNWHPMAPIGMSAADFNAVVTAATRPAGISFVQATQNAVGVTYTPAGTYTPPYWSSVPSTNGKVMLITATQPFCVNSTTGSVTLPIPAITGACSLGNNYYGSQSGGAPQTTRFLDWGLVQDDTTRPTAQTFFQPATCTTCLAGGPNGLQNGILYIPLTPPINVLGLACAQNVNPGTSVFDELNAGGPSCANPPTQTISSTSVTFTGTKSNPEGLVIDNAGMGAVSISGSLPGNGGTCSSINFDNYNVGMILATGDLTVANNLVLKGFIYTPGQVTLNGTTAFSGGILSPFAPKATPPTTSTTTNFSSATTACGNSLGFLSPLIFNFQGVSWQDRPMSKP